MTRTDVPLTVRGVGTGIPTTPTESTDPTPVDPTGPPLVDVDPDASGAPLALCASWVSLDGPGLDDGIQRAVSDPVSAPANPTPSPHGPPHIRRRVHRPERPDPERPASSGLDLGGAVPAALPPILLGPALAVPRNPRAC